MTQDSFKILSLKKEHVPSVIQLLQELSEFSPPYIDVEKMWNLFKAQTNVYALVACEGNNILSYGSIHIYRNIRGSNIGFIEDVVTSRNHRNRGIGMKVLDALERIANENHCYKIVLQSTKNSVAFYQKLGFSLNAGSGMVKFT
ncbi:GNAT family N-acetyltransferase [Gammaproteobacteria bacterium]|nr:GNAT family N-acetyltransferase [Gammaproteobacteria bacterium]